MQDVFKNILLSLTSCKCMENIACKINHKSPFFPPLLFSFETFRVRCIYCIVYVAFGLPGGLVGGESACSVGVAGDVASVLGSRSPGGGHGSPIQYSCLVNSVDRGA